MNTIVTKINFSYQYILGIMNSRLAEWYYYWFVYNRAIRTIHFDQFYLGRLPIKIPSKTNRAVISKMESLVDQILSLKNQDCSVDTSDLESQIDQLVYELYDLTPEEIAIIEGNSNNAN